MAVTFQSLNNSSPETIRNCFNESFSDYFIPFYLSAEQFENKIAAEAIDLSLSFGVFENNILAGFILNGIDTIEAVQTAYNAGTGVLPHFRGKGLSFALYEYCIDQLRKAAVKRSVLEVFQQNTQAIKTYQKAGFVITRNINSYKGRPATTTDQAIEIKVPEEVDWNWINKHAAWQPAWQYNNHTLQRGWHQYQLFVAYERATATAYIIFNPASGRVALFGAATSVDEQLYLAALFTHAGAICQQDLSVAHVGSVHAENFLQQLGLQPFIYSYEMERDL